MMEHLILVDASGYAHWSFHAQNPQYRDDGAGATGATEIFLGLLWRLLGRAQQDEPTMGVAVFDPPGGNFRHDLFPAYKANRPASARQQELGPQFPIMQAAADLLGLVPMERAGFEADDVIATLAHKARAKGIRVTIVSRDKDFHQLVEDGKIEIVEPVARKRVLEADVIKKFGVAPALVPDVQALAGDTVDNIPGLPGCGLDIAAKLIRTFGGLEQVLLNAERVRFPVVRAGLKRMRAYEGLEPRTGADWARLFLQLTTLRRDVPGRVKFEDYRRKPIMKADLDTFLKKLGAAGRAESIFGMDPQLLRVVEPVKAPLAWWREELQFPGQKVPDMPQVGFYQRKEFRDGAFVPARIWREPEFNQATDEPTGMDILRCQLGSKFRDPLAEWPRLFTQPITEESFNTAMKKYGPGLPPPATGPVDLTKVKSIPNPARKRHV